MSYIDAAVSGTVIVEPQLKQSAKGNSYARFLLLVGKDAERVAPLLKKGGRAYAEGELSSQVYQRNGEPTVSLSIAARRCEVLNQIGRDRPKREKQDDGGRGIPADYAPAKQGYARHAGEFEDEERWH
jgi:single-stranded DNA-binding protein